MYHHHSKLKRLTGSEDIIHTNNSNSEGSLWPWPWTQNASIFTGHFGLWWSTYYQTKFGCNRINSSEDIVKTIIFWLYRPCHPDLDPDDRNLSSSFFFFFFFFSLSRITLLPLMMHDHTKFGYKRLSGWDDKTGHTDRQTTCDSNIPHGYVGGRGE